MISTDTGEDSKLVHRRKRPKVDTLFSSLFFRRVRATSMTQRRVENTPVHFWTFSPVSVNPGGLAVQCERTASSRPRISIFLNKPRLRLNEIKIQ